MIAMLAQVGTARSERLREINTHFREPDPQVYMHIAVALLAILAIFLVIRLLNYLQNRSQDGVKAQPIALYLRVAAQMGLSLLDRWQLWRLAKSAGIANPACLLISPVLFDRAVQRYLSNRAGSSHGERLSSIRKRLFGQAALLTIDPVLGGD